jgi:hypothetical protein
MDFITDIGNIRSCISIPIKVWQAAEVGIQLHNWDGFVQYQQHRINWRDREVHHVRASLFCQEGIFRLAASIQSVVHLGMSFTSPYRLETESQKKDCIELSAREIFSCNVIRLAFNEAFKANYSAVVLI